MKEIVILSGKGGTGKTSLTASFALLADNPVICDADVDAADLHLLLQPDVKQQHDFVGGIHADILKEKCTECGYCQELCRFDAIRADHTIDAINCEGCGVCAYFCPEHAIDLPFKKSGEWFVSDTRAGEMIHARLGIAEENSGKLVSLVRRESRSRAKQNNNNLILTDGPPGIGCPVIAALGGAEAVVIVVEPTVSGLHDVKRIAALSHHFGQIPMLCINRYDINRTIALEITHFCNNHDIKVLPAIPFDADFTRAMVQGKTLIEYAPNSMAAKEIYRLWQAILELSEKGILMPSQLHLHL